VSSPDVRALVESGVAAAAGALGLPGLVVPVIPDLLETLMGSADAVSAAERLKQNALADADDAAAEAAAVALNKAERAR